MALVGVTGATGFVGGAVAGMLASAGVAQRLLVRDPERAPRLPGADVRVFSFADRAQGESALAGVDTLLFVSASESADRREQHRTVVDAAAAAGVQHVVYTSFVNAAPDATFTLARDHYATEENIQASGMAYTVLRDNLYLDFLPSMAGEDGVIRGPADDGRAAVVARADVARAAFAVLSDPAPHQGRSYDLTGPEAITLHEAAATLTTGLGRSITYQSETVTQAYASRAGYSAPEWQLDAWVSTYTAIAHGDLDQVSDDVQTLTGRRPLSLAEFLAHGG